MQVRGDVSRLHGYGYGAWPWAYPPVPVREKISEVNVMIRGTLYCRRYPIGTLNLIIRTDVKNLFDSIDMCPFEDEAASDTETVELFVLGRAGASAVPIDIPQDAIPLIIEQRCRLAQSGGIVFGFWHGRARSMTKTGGGFAVISIPDLRGMNTRYLARTVVRPILDRLIMDTGRVILHAAAAVKNNAGIILVGNAGSGKSTIVHGLMDRGWAFLGDDRVVLVMEDSGREAIHAFPEYIRHASTKSGPKQCIIPAKTTVHARPSALIFLTPSTGAPELTRISPADASARLVQAVPRLWNQQGYECVLDIIVATCATAKCWTMACGSKPESTVDVVTALAK